MVNGEGRGNENGEIQFEPTYIISGTVEDWVKKYESLEEDYAILLQQKEAWRAEYEKLVDEYNILLMKHSILMVQKEEEYHNSSVRDAIWGFFPIIGDIYSAIMVLYHFYADYKARGKEEELWNLYLEQSKKRHERELSETENSTLNGIRNNVALNPWKTLPVIQDYMNNFTADRSAVGASALTIGNGGFSSPMGGVTPSGYSQNFATGSIIINQTPVDEQAIIQALGARVQNEVPAEQ
ncbi:MAG: hypothetical protein PVH29_10040 [Candidatus Zixiibacteriota bacterium]|jgi:hypothetical protein